MSLEGTTGTTGTTATTTAPAAAEVPAGEYTLRASIGAPASRRHGEEDAGPPLIEDAQVEFENVMIELDG